MMMVKTPDERKPNLLYTSLTASKLVECVWRAVSTRALSKMQLFQLSLRSLVRKKDMPAIVRIHTIDSMA